MNHFRPLLGYNQRSRNRILKRATAAILGFALAMGSLLGMGATAYAAPNQVQIDDLTFVTQTGVPIDGFEDGTKQWLAVDMSIPGEAQAPVSGTINLPGELLGQPETIILYAPDGTPNGTCRVAATSVFCELDDDYVTAHPDEMSGSFRFEVKVTVGNTEDIVTKFPIEDSWTNDVTITPPNTSPGAPCEQNCEIRPEPGTKMGWYYKENEEIGWEVRVPTPGPDGMEVGVPVVVTDEIDTNLFEVLPGSPYVEYYDRVFINDTGHESITNRRALPRNEYVVSENGSRVEFTTTAGAKDDPNLPANIRGLAGRVYWVTWAVKVLDNGAAGTYTNTATVIVGENGDELELEGEAIRQGGSGEAVGTNQGRLAFEKLVEGNAANDPELPTAYRVTYTACDTTQPDYNQGAHTGTGCEDGELDIRPGSTAWSKNFPAGTRVVGTEVVPTEPANVAWDGKFQLVDSQGTPIAGSSEDTIFDVTFTATNSNLGTLTYYRVTNEASYKATPFSAKKVIDDRDNLNPTGLDSFVLNYEYAAGAGGAFPAGSGSLDLPADGTIVFSEDLPIGAELRFTESTPPAVPGGVWGAAQITPATLTITENPPASNEASVVVINPLTAVPNPGFVLGKSANPGSGTTVHPGDTITYTVTGKNTGNTVLDPVRIEDDLDDLWDFVTYNDDAFATINGTDSAGPVNINSTTATASWTGALQPGETVTITYSVTVLEKASGQTLENRVTGSAKPPGVPPIIPPPTDTEHPVPVPGFTLGKTADPVDGTDVNPGDTITYTVTGANTGSTLLDPVVIEDDLTGLWDYVTYNNDAAATINGAAAPNAPVVDPTAGSLSWNGALATGETVTITYSVTVNEGAQGQELQNKVTGSATPPGVPPITPPPVDTEHPVPTPGFDVDKVADPAAGTEVNPGETITYTVTGENTGNRMLDPVVIEDDLSGVWEYATYNNDAVATINGADDAGALSVDTATHRLNWTGVLEPGETVTITYSVTVQIEAAGHILENRVTGIGTPPTGPPIEPPPVDTDHPVPVPGFEVDKSSTPRSGSTVNPGEAITYRVTGANTGQTLLDPVIIEDDLSGVLEYATFNDDAIAAINGLPTMTVPVFDADAQALTWNGVLAVSETVTITYSVTVNPEAAGKLLQNQVKGSATPPGHPPITPPEEGTEHPVPTPGFELDKTADPVNGTDVNPGEIITYTLTGENTGETVLDPVFIEDDLQGLWSFVTYNEDAAATINGGSASEGLVLDEDAETLVWSGVLEPNQTVTITYSVTVNVGASGEVLQNRVTGSATPPGHPPIEPPPVDTEHPVPTPGFEVFKSANPGDGTKVNPGETVTYTLTGVNTGETPLDPVVVEDDMSGLWEHATYNDDAFATINGTDSAGTLSQTGEALAWTGALDIGETVTITYSVTVGPDATGQILKNRVSGSATPPGVPPIDPPEVETEHPVPTPGFDLEKSADPADGSLVNPGDTITYTVIGTNTGETVLDPVVIDDDLSGLWEYATYNEDAYATINGTDSAGTLDLDLEAPSLQWNGVLNAGESVTITYSVTVSQEATGKVLENRATAAGTPPGTPPIEPPPVDTEHPVPTPGFELDKTANPQSGTTVKQGDKIVYTVTGANTGGTVLDPVVIEDDLSGLWEHVSYNDDAVATIDQAPAGNLTVDTKTQSLTWTGSLNVGKTVTITYSVTVNANAGGKLLENVVSATATPPGNPSIEPPKVKTEHPVLQPVGSPPSHNGLATTGMQPIGGLIACALLLIAAGATLRVRTSRTRI